ncbi:MAG TPA: hypothetical protein VKR06_21270 [Ktedonosporobacter sp.]|nr:hypothetical protein [Ktedonosporobacter sp.]
MAPPPLRGCKIAGSTGSTCSSDSIQASLCRQFERTGGTSLPRRFLYVETTTGNDPGGHRLELGPIS